MKQLFVLFTLIIVVVNMNAQTGKQQRVIGKVTDATTGQSLPGVNIVIEGTTTGTITDISGEYSIMVRDSESVLNFSFVSYITQSVKVGNQRTINIDLATDLLLLEEVVITAQAKGQKQAIRQQINSNTLKNVVAPDRLQENPDANAAEAIGRLPGVSVLRSGGEGVGLVIRGLEPKYSSVSLNGIQLPSTNGSNRGTNISGISLYALQGVEVYKSLTADLEANSVAGTVNLKLREAPKNFHINLMAQGGYNHLNNYWGNYKLLTELSNRFFNDKLGVLFTVNAERVNRSIQTMSAGYNIESSDPEGDILLDATNLNDIYSLIYRRSAMLSLDYKVSEGTTLMLYGIYNKVINDHQRQSKSYNMAGAGSVGYSFNSNPNNQNEIMQSSLSGKSKLRFLNIEADYGVSYSIGSISNMEGRNWNFTFNEASTSDITTIEKRKLDPSEVVPLFTDDPDNYLELWLNTMNVTESKIKDENYSAYLNLKIPFKLGEQISGNIKFGGMYREKNRMRNDLAGSQTTNSNANQYSPVILADSLDWIVLNSYNNVSAVGLSEGNVDDFLNGQYDFGNRFNINRLNQITDTWSSVSDYYFKQGPDVYLPVFGEIGKIGYMQNVAACMLNDQDIQEIYIAGYIMPEINFSKYAMLIPGLRLENTHTTMKGFYALPPNFPPPINAPVPGSDTSAIRSDQFLLPMVHLRIKPTNSFYMHFAYTQTLNRPDFNAISPNYFVNTGWSPFQYTASNPSLNPEFWTNFDAQFTLHSSKIGLLSVTVFYKTVEDKIWNRTYKRIKGDPIIEPFPDNASVNVTVWENHKYKAYVNGIEAEWQTSFYYLPKPFNFFTLYANYTYTNSKTYYPYTRIDNIIPPEGGRPVATRIDSVTTGPLLFQPKSIANISLGFSNKGFSAWLSYQYNGLIYTGKNYRGAPRLDRIKNHFSRWDLQITQKFSIKKVEGFEVLANIANLSNFSEVQNLAGDSRAIYQENYGITADLGLRFRF